MSKVDVEDDFPELREKVELLQNVNELTESKIKVDSSVIVEEKNIQFDLPKVEIENGSSNMIEIKDNNLKLEQKHQFENEDLKSEKCEASTINKNELIKIRITMNYSKYSGI